MSTWLVALSRTRRLASFYGSFSRETAPTSRPEYPISYLPLLAHYREQRVMCGLWQHVSNVSLREEDEVTYLMRRDLRWTRSADQRYRCVDALPRAVATTVRMSERVGLLSRWRGRLRPRSTVGCARDSKRVLNAHRGVVPMPARLPSPAAASPPFPSSPRAPSPAPRCSARSSARPSA